MENLYNKDLWFGHLVYIQKWIILCFTTQFSSELLYEVLENTEFILTIISV